MPGIKYASHILELHKSLQDVVEIVNRMIAVMNKMVDRIEKLEGEVQYLSKK